MMDEVIDCGDFKVVYRIRSKLIKPLKNGDQITLGFQFTEIDKDTVLLESFSAEPTDTTLKNLRFTRKEAKAMRERIEL